MADTERSPSQAKRRRSRSPETREYKHDGGGQSSARMRSPGYHARRDSRRDERPSNGDRDRRRDNGRDDRRSGRGEYSERDREKERDNDRKRYEDTVKKEPGEDVRQLALSGINQADKSRETNHQLKNRKSQTLEIQDYWQERRI